MVNQYQSILDFESSDPHIAAAEIFKTCKASKIFLFVGSLGAGKTTFIKEICKLIGYNDDVNSPTYSIISEYRGDQNLLIYHMDLYRLKSWSEAEEIGLLDYFDGGQYCFVEWPQIIFDYLDLPHYLVNIQAENQATRKYQVDFVG